MFDERQELRDPLAVLTVSGLCVAAPPARPLWLLRTGAARP